MFTIRNKWKGRKKFFLISKLWGRFQLAQIHFCTSLLIGILICAMIKTKPNSSVHIMRLRIFEQQLLILHSECACTEFLLFGFYLWVERILRFCWFIDSIQRQRWFEIFHDVDYVDFTKAYDTNVEKSMLSAGHINPHKHIDFRFHLLSIFKSFSELYSD